MYLHMTTLWWPSMSAYEYESTPSNAAKSSVGVVRVSEEQLRSPAQICRKIHKTWLQEVFVFQIVPPLIVLHVATIAWSKCCAGVLGASTGFNGNKLGAHTTSQQLHGNFITKIQGKNINRLGLFRACS